MNQQPEFEYPEQIKRVVNNDPREQRSSPGADYQPPEYMASYQTGAQKIYPPRSRKPRRWLWALAVIPAIPALLFGLQYALAGLHSPFSSQVSSHSSDQDSPGRNHAAFGASSILPQQSFSVQGIPNLTIKDPAGSVQIHRGNNDSVVIHPTLRCDHVCSRNDVSFKAETNGTTNPDITVQADFPDHDSVDLDITVPETSNIEVTDGAGDLTLNGVSGQMDLTAEAGALTFENGTIHGKSTFRDKAGAITFDGALAPDGDYSFKNEAGAIDMTLPADSAFALDARSGAGLVTNEFGSDTIGANPTSHVRASTTAGAVNIHKKEV